MIDPTEYNIILKKVKIDNEPLFIATVRELPDLREYALSYHQAYELTIKAIQLLYEFAMEKHRDFPVPEIYHIPQTKKEYFFTDKLLHDMEQTESLVKQDDNMTPTAKLFEELLNYLDLTPNWDGYEGVPPTQSAVGDAIRFVKKLPQYIPLPKPMLGGTGVVGLYWDKMGIYADVCFEGNGTFWYYVKDGQGNKIGEDDVLLKNLLPVPLLNVISSLA